MQNSIIHLIRYAKAQGCVISVNDGGAWAVKKSTNEKEILEAVNSVDEAFIRVYEPRGLEFESMGTATIINGLDKDELVADHTDNLWFQGWSEAYNAANVGA